MAGRLEIPLQEARHLRIALAHSTEAEEGEHRSAATAKLPDRAPCRGERLRRRRCHDGAPRCLGGARRAAHPRRSLVDQAIEEPLARLAEELSLCRRYHEAAFPDRPVQRLIFVGGEANNAPCVKPWRGNYLAAQVGDPMVRMSRTTDIGIESGMDRRCPQPAWAVAIGLSMGPPTGATVAST